jgi:hypothetical protein
MSVILLCVILH